MPNNSGVQGRVHVDRYLTNFSQRVMTDKSTFIAGRASTRVPVLNQSDIYTTFPRGYFLRDEVERRPLGGRPVQAGYKLGEGTYLAEEWALEHALDDRLRRNTDNQISLDENATEMLTTKQMIRGDRIWATKFFKTGVWSQDWAGVTATPTGNQFLRFDQSGSDLISFIDARRDAMNLATGVMPNTVVFGADVKRKMRVNADLVDRIKYTQLGIVTDALLQSVLEMDNVLTARAVYNSADETTAADGGENFQYIVSPKAFWMGYISPTAGLNTATAISNFAWTGLIPGQGNDFGGVISRGRDDRAYSDWFHSRQAFDLKGVSPDYGMFFDNAVS